MEIVQQLFEPLEGTWIGDFLIAIHSSPLIFTQRNFWVFFTVVYALYALVYDRQKLRSAFLFIASLYFYFTTSGLFVLILIFSTVSDFFLGRAVYRARQVSTKNLLVGISVFINLSVLCYFKYAYFFTDACNDLFQTDYQVFNHLAYWSNSWFNSGFSVDAIVLPVGISYYTFQTISYSVDIRRGDLKPVNSIIDFGFFVSFFPQLVAGPIVRASEFIPQIQKPFELSREDYGRGTYMILKGLAKKIILADYIAINFIDKVFDAPTMFTGFENLAALVGYSLQIYCDFSGYTDIAIGLALLMGFRLPTNFNSPYKAISAGEFWKRWHITLSSWLKDYLYIPLGGNRNGTFASGIITAVIIGGVLFALKDFWTTVIVLSIVGIMWLAAWRSANFKRLLNRNINITLTMLLGGLWHGASWQFVIWGGLNGVAVLTFKYWNRTLSTRNPEQASQHFLILWGLFNVLVGLNIWIQHTALLTYTEQQLQVSIGVFALAFIQQLIFPILLGFWQQVKSKNQNTTAYLAFARAVVTFNFLLCLIWLGAAWQFWLWTIVNSLALVLILAWPTISRSRWKIQWTLHPWKILVTFAFITFTRIFFRAQTMEVVQGLTEQIAYHFAFDKVGEIIVGFKWIFLLMLLGYIIHWLPGRWKDAIENRFVQATWPVQVGVIVISVIVMYQFISAGFTPFVYFQF